MIGKAVSVDEQGEETVLFGGVPLDCAGIEDVLLRGAESYVHTMAPTAPGTTVSARIVPLYIGSRRVSIAAEVLVTHAPEHGRLAITERVAMIKVHWEKE